MIKFDAVAASICEHDIVMRVPRRVAKSDEAVFLAIGILKAQNCALTEVNLYALSGHTRRQADFTAQPVNEFKIVAHGGDEPIVVCSLVPGSRKYRRRSWPRVLNAQKTIGAALLTLGRSGTLTPEARNANPE